MEQQIENEKQKDSNEILKARIETAALRIKALSEAIAIMASECSRSVDYPALAEIISEYADSIYRDNEDIVLSNQ